MNKPLVYGLLLSILLVILPHSSHLPIWVSVLCVMLLGWRAYLTYQGLPLPKRWLLILLTLACVGGILVNFRAPLGREVGVTMLILLVTLKQLELRSVRDATVVIYLACFIIITNFFYSQSIPTALFMFVTLLVIVMTWLHLQSATLTLKARLRIAAILLAQAIPLMLVLFVLFPRVQGPLWGLPQDAYASSGLDNKMSPGSLSKLSLSEAVAFRVEFTGTVPRRDQMYWRGPVLWNFDGQTWTPGRTSRFKLVQFDNLSSPADYTVTLEPHNKTWLFALDMPTRISIPADMTYDFRVVQKNPINARVRYNAHSQLGYRANAEEDPMQLQRALQLPDAGNPRARKLAQEWRNTNGSDELLLRAALDYYKRGGFQYTLEPPPLGSDFVDDFIFDTRQGFCEHYASSFVFLMRAAGVPARVVTGYQGGEYNALGGYYIVRQSDAHAWAEVWLKERGWVRIDPTAEAAPVRIESGLAAAVPDSTALPFMARTQSPWLLKLRFNLDTLANQWNQWVLGYNPERQFALLTRLGMESVSWQKIASFMAGFVALLVGLFALLMLRGLYKRNPDEAHRLYLKFCRKLGKAGLIRAAHEGPQDFAARAAQARPQQAAAIADLTARYIESRYASPENREALSSLRHAVTSFKI